MPTVSVRYIVDDVDAAIEFYCGRLGFHEDMRPAPPFAMLSRGDLRLLLSAPNRDGPGGGAAMPDGTMPAPGGWNRFQIEVDDLVATVARLRGRAGRGSATTSSTGVGGKQILVEDPAGNPVELFQPIRSEARLSQRQRLRLGVDLPLERETPDAGLLALKLGVDAQINVLRWDSDAVRTDPDWDGDAVTRLLGEVELARSSCRRGT